MDKRTFKQMAEDYPDKRDYFLDLHERYELDQDRTKAIEKDYEALGLNTEDINDGVRIPKKFLKLLQWYIVKDTKTNLTEPDAEQKRILAILKTIFEMRE